LLFSRLLRDADKLDIWRVVTECYFVSGHEKNGAIVFGLPETADFSFDAYENLISKKLVEVEQIRCANDLRLLQLSWLYDVNFVPTFRRIKQRQYVETLIRFLPSSEKVETAKKLLHDYLSEKINGKENEYKEANYLLRECWD